MITEKDLQEAIAECQGERNPNSRTCLKLASYYIIKDHLFNKQELPTPSYSYSNGPTTITYDGDSEFLQVLKSKNIDDILPILDELMTTLNVINPRLYEGVMTKLLY